MSTTHNGRGTHPPGSQTSRFFEKAAPALQTIRRSTPDSEALASSDDDHEHPLSKSTHSLQSGQAVGMPRPARRASWLSEVQAGTQRKFSIGSSSSLQQSQPTTPAAENGPASWNLPGIRPPVPTGSYPWTGAWTMAPSTALPDAVSIGTSTSAIDDVQPLMSPTTEDHEFLDDTAPYQFNVSYTPVRKNVRSQSYSAGQQPAADEKANGIRGTTRVAHRPSRPSMLGEGGTGRPALGLVMEDEDDEAVADSLLYTTRTNPGRHEQMSSYNIPNPSLLKQAAVENALLKQRHTHAIPNPLSMDASQAYLAQMAQSNLQHAASTSWNANQEGVPVTQPSSDAPPVNKQGQGQYVQQPTWSSNLGFGEIVQPSESRRASFADPRSGISGVPKARTMSSSLHSSEDARSLPGQDLGHATSQDELYQQQGTLNPYAVPQTFSTPTPDLFIVAFKCARAGTFYVPPNTGLEVKVGDNVIVEGDRGVDLGTVTHAQVTLSEAKQLTQAAKDAHFKWLMMFSKTKQVQPGSSIGVMTAPEEPPTAGGNRSQSANSKAEDRPKMIRSIATHHQIQQLREKEGAEAKAKRVAQVKVGEHQLEMEILDAEMQYDWKKLTFFFYSPKYVNFNNLVIDLFKIYKTRIWMDAITNGTSQGAQDEVLGAAGPVVASSSQPALPSNPVRDLIGGAGPKKTAARAARPEADTYTDTAPFATNYSTAGASSPPLNVQPYSAMSPVNPNYMGSPPLSASAYSPYDGNQAEMPFQNQYGSYQINAAQANMNNSQWGWKHMQPPPAANNPGWNHVQPPPNLPHPSLATGQPLTDASQRLRSSAADTEQLTAYLRNLALHSPR